MKVKIALLIKKTLTNLGYKNLDDFSVDYPPQESFGDYASNAGIVAAKAEKKDPMAVAEEIAEKLRNHEGGGIFEKAEVVKPGFINLTLSRAVLNRELRTVLRQKNKFGRQNLGRGQKVLLEYFQPNIAKPLHLGHLRTAIIGDSLFKILNFVGYKVKSDTHLGDWGTQFGLLLYAYKKFGDEKVVSKDPINELNKLYIRVNAEMEKNKEVRDLGKTEFLKLEKGDLESRQIWQRFVDWSWKEFDKIYDTLNIRRADHNWPESFYEEKMPQVLQMLKEKKLLRESEGAQIIDLENYKLGIAIVVKSDGATTYLLRDLAAFIFRKSEGYKKQLYVVDTRQSHTFRQLFKILELAGYLENSEEAVHVDFGFLSLPGRQAGLPEGAMSTRKGNVVGPEELLKRGRELAAKIIEEKNPDLPDKEKVADAVVRGAVKYFDLSHNRKSDIVFRWDEVLNFEGNTGPYLQYTHARIKSILRKKDEVKIPREPQFNFAEEQALIRQMIRYPEILTEAAAAYYPHYLAEYLFQLAGKFNNFYQKIRVLNEPDDALRASRLMLITAVAQVLKNGLELLGIEALEEM